MEAFERRDCAVAILQENSTVHLYLYKVFMIWILLIRVYIFDIARGVSVIA